MGKTKAKRECYCEFCGGEPRPLSTWYDHNPGGRKKQCPPLPQETIEVILRQPKTDTVPPKRRARKKRLDRLDEEVEAAPHTSKRAVRSASVRMGICASNTRYSQNYASRMLKSIRNLVVGMKCPPKCPSFSVLATRSSPGKIPTPCLLLRY